jgi:hypothetical protein
MRVLVSYGSTMGGTAGIAEPRCCVALAQGGLKP